MPLNYYIYVYEVCVYIQGVGKILLLKCKNTKLANIKKVLKVTILMLYYYNIMLLYTISFKKYIILLLSIIILKLPST